MIVGFTYDLKNDYAKIAYNHPNIEIFDDEETISGIEIILHNLGYEVQRVGNINNLVKYISRGQRWDIVFNICRGSYTFKGQLQVPALLEAFNIPYVFSDSYTIILSSNKALIKQIVNTFDIKTPNFIVIDNEKLINNIPLSFPVIVKPLFGCNSIGINSNSKCENEKEMINAFKKIYSEITKEIIVEEFLDGREFITGIVGFGEQTECIGTIEIVFNNLKDNNIYTLNAKKDLKYISFKIPEIQISQKCEKLALTIWKKLNCKDGGTIKFRTNEKGELYFLDINLIPALHPTKSEFSFLAKFKGFDFMTLMEKIMNSAIKRTKLM